MTSEAMIAELKNVLYLDRVFSALQLLDMRSSTGPIDLRTAELRVFSQHGEDGVLDALIRALDPPRTFVEFGVESGWSCNCRLLAEVRGWEGVFIEPDSAAFDQLQHRYRFSTDVRCHQGFVTPTNVNQLFASLGVPRRFGVLSIDTDGQDYWIWKALSDEFEPEIVIIEFNAEHGANDRVVEEIGTNPEDPLGRQWGASSAALIDLAAEKDYTLVHIEMAQVNLFFVRNATLARLEDLAITGRIGSSSPNYGLRGCGLSEEAAYPGGTRRERSMRRVGGGV